MKYPYSDEDMVYDKLKHRYVLTEQGVLNNLGINASEYLDTTGDANPSTLAQRVNDRISAHLYRRIYAFNKPAKPYTEYLLAKMPECRELIKECLLNETYYNYRNGDFYNSIDSDVPWERAVSPDTRDRLSEPLSNGYNLLYGGRVVLRDKIAFREDY